MTEQPGTTERVVLKPGWKTTEFWVSVTTGGVLPFVLGALPATWQAVISAGAGAIYALSRGLAKLGIQGPRRS